MKFKYESGNGAFFSIYLLYLAVIKNNSHLYLKKDSVPFFWNAYIVKCNLLSIKFSQAIFLMKGNSIYLPITHFGDIYFDWRTDP